MKRNKAVLKLPTFQWGKPGNSFSYSWVTDVFGQSKCSESRGNGKIRGVISAKLIIRMKIQVFL